MVTRADDGDDGSQVVTIEFLMVSGETFTVQEFIDGNAPDDAIKRLGEQIAGQVGTSTTRQFPYWEGEQFFFDAVRMDQVAAFSVALAEADDDDEVE